MPQAVRFAPVLLALLCLQPGEATVGVRAQQAPSAAPVRLLSVTPNLVVADMARSITFYRDVLGFRVTETVPEKPPYVFAQLVRDEVTVFVNDRAVAARDLPALAARELGGGNTLYFRLAGVAALHAQVKGRAREVLALVDQPYGMREFGIADPDGYVLLFAEPIAR